MPLAGRRLGRVSGGFCDLLLDLARRRRLRRLNRLRLPQRSCNGGPPCVLPPPPPPPPHLFLLANVICGGDFAGPHILASNKRCRLEPRLGIASAIPPLPREGGVGIVDSSFGSRGTACIAADFATGRIFARPVGRLARTP